MKIFAYIFLYFFKIFSRILMYFFKSLFKSTGRNNIFSPFDSFSYHTISLGDDVFIGKGAKFSSITSIVIGSKVMFGPNVTIMGGDHNTTVVGQYMFDVKDKLKNNDLPVIIENDVWIGANCIILKGVTIGQGSIIGAGSLVTKSIPPNSVALGHPAKVVRKRFSDDQYILHINHLNESQSID